MFYRITNREKEGGGEGHVGPRQYRHLFLSAKNLLVISLEVCLGGRYRAVAFLDFEALKAF